MGYVCYIFIPLWLSIVVLDAWNVVSLALEKWDDKSKMLENSKNILYSSSVQVTSIIVIAILVISSIVGINSFLKRKLTIANIYIESHDQLTRKDISLDHFVPWSFCAHDELWNLVPTTKSINSSKSNNLPNWDVFFPQLCDVEYQSYELIWDNEHVNKAFQQVRKQHVNSPDAELKLYQPGISKDTFANNLHDIILPSYQAAKNIGYMEWRGYDK